MLVNMVGDLTPIAVSEILKSKLVGNTYALTPIFSVATDSREVDIGCMFIAIKGERVDGHMYINKAAENGAVDDIVTADAAADAVISALDMLASKRVSTLEKKHSNMPY